MTSRAKRERRERNRSGARGAESSEPLERDRDRPKVRAEGAAATLLGASLLVLLTGCVKEDPLIVGNRDASTDARPPIGTIVPLADPPDEDPATCRHCAETLSTDSARGTLCRKNGAPSSVRRLNALVDCLCYDKCVQECGNYCAGGPQESGCSVCVLSQCGDEINACLADTKGGG
jgi:hypothetical protein